MNLNEIKVSSRPLGVAQKLLDRPVDSDLLSKKNVVLIAESDALLSQNGKWCFMNALALLACIAKKLAIFIPPTAPELRVAAKRFGDSKLIHNEIHWMEELSEASLDGADAILNIGSATSSHLPWTSINSNGWVGRVSSGPQSLPTDTEQPNPIGAMAAASLGVTEVFKRIFDVPIDIAPLLDKTEFSLFDYCFEPTSVGPRLPETITIPDTLLVGAGAIGNAIALLCSQLPLLGRMHVVDNQHYGDENFGTCLLLQREGWIGEPKATRMSTWLLENSQLTATGQQSDVAYAARELESHGLRVDLVLNALDNGDARREAQSIWPQLIVDGGINEVGAAVTQFNLDREEHACLKCWFEPPKINEKQIQSDLTGLKAESLEEMGRILTAAEISEAAPEKREWLQKQTAAGKTLCSIISEATLSAKLGVDAAEGFRPSVPFIASLAASMVVAEAIKWLTLRSPSADSLVQIANVFWGPEQTFFRARRAPSKNCQCVSHRKLIQDLRKKRL